MRHHVSTLILSFGLALLIAGSTGAVHAVNADADTKDAAKSAKTAKAEREIAKVLNAGKAAGKLPDGVVIRLRANLFHAVPADPKERADAEARGVDFTTRLDETWEFTSKQVHKVVIESTKQQQMYHRIKSLPFNSKHLSKTLLDGKVFQIEADEADGDLLLFFGTQYELGARSIEVIFKGRTHILLGESCAGGGYAERDARAFAELYETLARQARAVFENKSGKKKNQ